MSSRSVPSPMEQGELEASPDLRNSPDIILEEPDDDLSLLQPLSSARMLEKSTKSSKLGREEAHITISPDDRHDDLEEGLNIQPPQVSSGHKERHRHRHKEGKKHSKDKKYSEVDRYQRKPERQSSKYDAKYQIKPPKRDEELEVEENRRKKSLAERDRLERLERERYRLERERERKYREQQERAAKEEQEKKAAKEELEKRMKEDERRDAQKRSLDYDRRQTARDDDRRTTELDRRSRSHLHKEEERKRLPQDIPRDRRKTKEHTGHQGWRTRSRSPLSRDVERDRSRDGPRDNTKADMQHDIHKERQRDSNRDSRRETKDFGQGEGRRDIEKEVPLSRPSRVSERRSESPSSSNSEYEVERSDSHYNYKQPPRPPGGASAMVESDNETNPSEHSPDEERKRSVSPDRTDDNKSDTGSDGSERSSKSGSSSEHSGSNLHDHLPRSKFDSTAHDDSSHSDHSSRSPSCTPSHDDDHEDYHSESPVPSPVIMKPELPPYYPGFSGCRNVEEFHCLNRIEEGTYGVVYRARDVKTDEIVALKRLKMEKEREGFPITALREINTLLKAQHPNIVTVREIVVGSNMDKIYIVMDYVEHDLKSLMESMKESFSMGEVKTLMLQLLRGVGHLHDNWIIHRDLKTSNLLLSHKGILKIGDFGLAREYGSPLKHYTPIVVTLWYRAPELLLGTKEYSTPIDMWSVGCIFAEFLMKKPLFPGKSEIDELNQIFKELGTPTEKIWPGVGELPAMKKCTFTEYPYNQLRSRFGSLLSDRGFDLLNKFLTYNPARRITAEDAKKHDFFTESPVPVDPSMFPTWPAKSEHSRTRVHGNSPRPPSGGKAYAKLMAEDDEINAGFHLSASAAGIASAAAGFALKF